ncbi:hypothetical protein RF55_12246 [Lasius niger]|uniref:Endonuclease/exonuclease/phosphatase domain-containing protein n=1 Tax=Lasius niger TaxID=67767 RepID=A0A0J7KD65_LASNI|nr:hypothetical protein RF55_12246 [Lasius niger]
MVMGIRVGIEVEVLRGNGMEEMMEIIVNLGGVKWRMVGVYVKEDMEAKLEGMRDWMEGVGGRVKTIIGGDFNARTGELGGGTEEGEEESGERGRSKDKKVNRERRLLVDRLEEVGWTILNGGVEGDEEGNWTFVGAKGQLVIDYVLGNENVRDAVEKMEVGDRIETDHLPLLIRLKGKGVGRFKKIKAGKGRWDWTGEGRREFREVLGKVRGGLEEVEKEWGKIKGRIKKILEKKGRTREGGKERKKDEDEENEKWLKRAQEAKTEGQVWKIVKKERWKGGGRGVEGRVTLEISKGWKEDEEEMLRKEEIKGALGKLRDKKAVGNNNILAEVWKYGGEELEGWIWDICNKVWRGEGCIKEWNKGWVVPILKNGKGRKIGEFRGITLMPSMYKIYTTILAERLRDDVEGKGLIPPNQAGFRK